MIKLPERTEAQLRSHVSRCMMVDR